MMESAASQCKFLSNRFAVNEVLIQRKRLSKTSKALKCLDKLPDEAFSPPYFYSLCCWKIVSEVALPKLYLVLCFIYTWKRSLNLSQLLWSWALEHTIRIHNVFISTSFFCHLVDEFVSATGLHAEANVIFTNCKYQHWCSFLFLFCFYQTLQSPGCTKYYCLVSKLWELNCTHKQRSRKWSYNTHIF